MTDQTPDFVRRMFLTLSGAAALGVLASPTEAAAAMSEIDRKNVEAVKGMSAAWKTGDAAKVVSFMHDKIAFRGSAERMDLPPTVGKDNFARSIASFLQVTKIDMRVLDAFALAPVVITCHHQLFENKEKGLHEDLYIACFYLEGGKIREWNDYAIIPYAQPRQKDTPGRGHFVHVA